MAHISLNVDGEVEIRNKIASNTGCIMFKLTSWNNDQRETVYSKDTVFIHGSDAEIRSFARKILWALSGQETKEGDRVRISYTGTLDPSVVHVIDDEVTEEIIKKFEEQ